MIFHVQTFMFCVYFNRLSVLKEKNNEHEMTKYFIIFIIIIVLNE